MKRPDESGLFHQPVLPEESVGGLAVVRGGVYVDATYGGGGHSRLILEKMQEGTLVAFDQDADAAGRAARDERVVFIHQNFRHLKRMLKANGIGKVDGILADLGISSHQVDTPERGFAHRTDGPLDMRMDAGQATSAAEVLNRYSPESLQHVFSIYGEVRNARSLATAIAAARQHQLFQTTGDLITAIQPLIRGNRNRYLSQVFQALRMEVNDELNALKEFLQQSLEVLRNHGRLVVISYHSLEDRLVKNVMRTGNAEGMMHRDVFGHAATVMKMLTRKPVQPGTEEIRNNPRARSARMRIGEKQAE